MNKVILTGRLTKDPDKCPKSKSWAKRFQEKPKGYKKTLVNPSHKQLVDAGLASKETYNSAFRAQQIRGKK